MVGLILPWSVGMMGGQPPLTYSYVTTYDYGGSASETLTFSSCDLGTAASNRMVVVAVHHSYNYFATSLTINGVSATKAVSQSTDPVGASGEVSLWYASVPTGDTGAIVQTHSGGEDEYCRIGIWAVYNAKSTTPTTGKTSVGSGTISLAATVPTNGVGIVAVVDEYNGANHAPTNYTERYDAQMIDRDGATGGDFTTSATLSCLNSTSNAYAKAMVYASWR